jgi:hypothetical protein
MKTIVKSFRIDENDAKKLEEIHKLYKERHTKLVATGNMLNVHRWTLANTIQVLIRDTYEVLVHEGKIKPIEEE